MLEPRYLKLLSFVSSLVAARWALSLILFIKTFKSSCDDFDIELKGTLQPRTSFVNLGSLLAQDLGGVGGESKMHLVVDCEVFRIGTFSYQHPQRGILNPLYRAMKIPCLQYHVAFWIVILKKKEFKLELMHNRAKVINKRTEMPFYKRTLRACVHRKAVLESGRM